MRWNRNIDRIISESVSSVLNEMGTVKQNTLLQKLVGDNRYDNLSVKDASAKIDQLLKQQPKRPMSEKQSGYLKKLANNGWLKRFNENDWIELINLAAQNPDKIDLNLASKLIDVTREHITFLLNINRNADSYSAYECKELDKRLLAVGNEVRNALGIGR